jgi:hypothetical protein
VILLLAGLLLTAPAPDPSAAFDARMVASASAAEAFQGPLDGAWVVRDGRGQPLLRLEIEDPPPGSGSPTGAWSLADGSTMGAIERIEATRGGVRIQITPDERLVLQRLRGRWRGRMVEAGRTSLVILGRR